MTRWPGNSHWMGKGTHSIDQSVEGQSWNTRLKLQLLQREAEELIPQTREDRKWPQTARSQPSKNDERKRT